MRFAVVLVLAGLALTAACTASSSSNVPTSAMTAEMQVLVDPGDPSAVAEGFLGRPGTSVLAVHLFTDAAQTQVAALGKGDTLMVTAAGETETLQSAAADGGLAFWVAAYDNAAAAGTTYAVIFDRETQTSAPASSCTVPAAFTVSSPSSGTAFSRAGDAVPLTYAPVADGGSMGFTVSGPCIEPFSATGLADTGTLTLAPGTLSGLDGGGGGTDGGAFCTVQVAITRTAAGTIDKAFKGGSFACTQIRAAQFVSMP